MKIYLSGPMTNDSGHEPKFNDAETYFKYHGYDVVNPVTVGKKLKKELGREPTYKEYLLADIAELIYCDIIYLLPNWDKSNGSLIEFNVAKALHLLCTSYLIPNEDINKIKEQYHG